MQLPAPHRRRNTAPESHSSFGSCLTVDLPSPFLTYLLIPPLSRGIPELSETIAVFIVLVTGCKVTSSGDTLRGGSTRTRKKSIFFCSI